jgi:acyl transferase domain-containing protein
MPSEKGIGGSGAETLSPVKQALLEIRALRARLAESEAARLEPIAIVGMAVRVPGGVSTLEDYWKMLESGGSGITEVPAERWDVDRFYSADPTVPGKIYTRYGGFIQDVDRFDAEFFGINPREAERIDPQQRLLLEVSWEALEHAGIDPSSLAGTATGVYLGLSNSDYSRQMLGEIASIDPYSVLGGALSIAAGRLSYFLNVHGPSLVIDTSCSSSLVAAHLACNSLRLRETNLALVGGGNLVLSPAASVGFSKTRMLAPDGSCKSFDASANGYVRGEGIAAVVLKRLSDAQRDGDRVLAVIRGTAVNQDGRSAGVTAPNGPAQESVIRAALAAGGVAAKEVDFVECHGTGTPLGDPIEVQALASVYGEGRALANPLLIGTVKANIGHLEAAAGLAGLIKTVLALEHEALPPQIHFNEPSPHIPWGSIPVRVTKSKTEWRRGARSRIAGLSSFGFSGTNAHMILEEAPAETLSSAESERPAYLLCLSARTPGALRELATRYDRWMDSSQESIADICFTANAGRAHHAHRLSVRARTLDELRARLGSWIRHGAAEGVVSGGGEEGGSQMALLFQGSGAEGVAAIAEISADSPAFREAFAECEAIAEPYLAQSLISIPNSILNSSQSMVLSRDSARIAARSFAAEYALSRFYASLGIEPEMVMGQGAGEYVAACVAGALALEDAIKLVADAEESGAGMEFSRPHTAWVSSRTGQVENGIPRLGRYKGANGIPKNGVPNMLAAGVRTILERGIPVIVSIGGKDFKQLDGSPAGGVISSFGADTGAWEGLLKSLQVLYASGVKIDWAALDMGSARRKVSLPAYPFQRKRFWLAYAGIQAEASESLLEVATETVGVPPLAAALRAAPETEREERMLEYIAAAVKQSLQLDPAIGLGARDRLTDLGMDSLIALELKSRLAKELGLGENVSATVAFDAGTVGELSRQMMELVFSSAAPVEVAAAREEPSRPAATLSIDDISEMSDEQVELLLSARLEKSA